METRRQFYYNIRYIYRQIQRVRTWQLLIILVLSAFVAATFLRINNNGMHERRKAVLAADAAGRDGDIADRLIDLQHYVAAHMNTSTDAFYLEGLYNYDKQVAIEKAADDANPNGNINVLADAACAPHFTVYSQAYLQCFIDELNKYPSAPNLDSDPSLPHPAEYRHSFAAPLWSADFAGFSVLLTVGIVLIIAARGLYFGFLMLLLKLRQRGIGS